MTNKNQVKWSEFLKDVLICSLGAYGGPEAHYGVFADQLVAKKKYITEEELVEFIALTGILPGPSSTQTLVAIGHKVGGPFLALLTMLVWALPVLSVMTLLSFMGQLLFNYNISEDAFSAVCIKQGMGLTLPYPPDCSESPHPGTSVHPQPCALRFRCT